MQNVLIYSKYFPQRINNVYGVFVNMRQYVDYEHKVISWHIYEYNNLGEIKFYDFITPVDPVPG